MLIGEWTNSNFWTFIGFWKKMFENLQYRHFLFFERPDFDVSPYKYTFQTMSIYEYLLCAHQECLGLASNSPFPLNIKVIPPANSCSFVLSCVSRAYVIYIITSPNFLLQWKRYGSTCIAPHTSLEIRYGPRAKLHVSADVPATSLWTDQLVVESNFLPVLKIWLEFHRHNPMDWGSLSEVREYFIRNPGSSCGLFMGGT